MSNFSVPDTWESEIIRRNGMNPDEYSVILSGEDFLVLLCHKSRDTIHIRKGEKKW